MKTAFPVPAAATDPLRNVGTLIMATRALVNKKIARFDPLAARRHHRTVMIAKCMIAILFRRPVDRVSIRDFMAVSPRNIVRCLGARLSASQVREVIRAVEILQAHARSFQRHRCRIRYAVATASLFESVWAEQDRFIRFIRARPGLHPARRRPRCSSRRLPRARVAAGRRGVKSGRRPGRRRCRRPRWRGS